MGEDGTAAVAVEGGKINEECVVGLDREEGETPLPFPYGQAAPIALHAGRNSWFHIR